ncbi:hypothetical protein MO973_19755 [Paenibacillus sp. TRM 82003]|nr:hypothetical protein [Paenibacillus sp. TRM 82003]
MFASKAARRNDKRKAASIYRPGRLRTTAGIVWTGLLWGGAGWLFFELAAVSAALTLCGAAIGWRRKGEAVRKMKSSASVQFEQMLYAIASSLQAGKSVENAFRDAELDLRLMYAGNASILLRELEGMNRMLENGTPLEKAVDHFQKRIDIPEVTTWSEIFGTCKRTGGDLVRVMRHSSRAVVEKLNMEREMAVLIAGKRFEGKALAIVPFFMIGAFRYGSPDYLEPLYSGSGRLVMLAALTLMYAGNRLAERWMRIEV